MSDKEIKFRMGKRLHNKTNMRKVFYVQCKVSFSKIIYKHLEITKETAFVRCS